MIIRVHPTIPGHMVPLALHAVGEVMAWRGRMEIGEGRMAEVNGTSFMVQRNAKSWSVFICAHYPVPLPVPGKPQLRAVL